MKSSFPPKTLTFSTATLRNQRTLVWLQQQSASVPWWKWDGVVSSLEDYHRWSAHGASIVGVVLCDERQKEQEEKKEQKDVWLDEVYRVAKKVQFVMLPRAILSWKTEEYWKDNFDNVFQLEEIHESYPFVGRKWDGTAKDAIHILALICRYHRLVDSGADSSERPCYEMVVEENSRPVELVLFTQFYTASAKKRTLELVECLKRNIKCKWVDRVVLLNEKDESATWASFPAKYKGKIEQRIIGRRLTYADFFQEVIRRYPGGLGGLGGLDGLDAVVALVNADIYVGEEMAEVWRIRWEDRALCLLRWDDLGEGASRARLFGPRSDSQDVWMFSATSVTSRQWPWKEVDIPLGKPGCDNAILHLLLKQRFLLSNPALSLKTYHLHNSGIRSYGNGDTVYSPVYIHLEPTYLVDTKQEFTPRESPQHVCNEVVPFTIKSSSMSNEITYCTMLEKEGRYRWEPTVENYYFEPAIPVYTWRQGAGVTPNGLVYDLYHIYTGRSIHQPEYNYWPMAGVDIFTPLRSCKRMAAIPLADAGSVFTSTDSTDSYLLFYFSRYLRILSTLPKGQHLGYWMPRELEEWSTWKDYSSWNRDGIPWDKGTGCWAEEVVGYLPGPSVAELGREDIMMLREHCRGWLPSPLEGKEGRSCIVVGDELLTEAWIQELRHILPESWNVQGPVNHEAWFGASLCIVVSGPNTAKWSPVWRLPKNAVVLEFQQELSISGECQHVAHVADLSSWVMLLSKGSTEDVQSDILTGIRTWWGKNQAVFASPSPSLSPSNPSRSLPQR